MEIQEKNLNILVSHFTDNLLKSYRLLDIYVSLKKQLNDLEDIWFSQETMSKILYQKERIFKCEKAKVDGARWEINFAESIEDYLNKLDDQKLTNIFELLKKASQKENPRIEGYPLHGDFWRYQIGNEKSDICRITCRFDIPKLIILVLRISPPYKSIMY